ncbi:exopolysaccharide biosynthesis protein [Hyphococcus flavus]|uniref:Exopolysaccharide biosynthesis protein n=1 Tax=Hyphococcus flavus TaxID=1866326 RepID=A0AAE9ZGP5_9PROT|nr:exopolysaccharide biosynthesis protein [Hyphococcus flavus]WDI32432.1 exopolysaccharide biosynthesis protein [Hyphococcus flavus]
MPSEKAQSAGGAPLEKILDEAIENSENGALNLGVLLKAWGDRSYGPLFIFFGFIGGTPLAVIPGAAAVVGIIIAGIALQMLLGLAHPWLPKLLLEKSIKEEDLRYTRKKVEPSLVFIDRLITERLTWVMIEPMRRAAAFFVAVLGLLMIPFDVIPFIVAAPAWSIVLFGVAITARDGLVMIMALLACFGVALLGVSAF